MFPGCEASSTCKTRFDRGGQNGPHRDRQNPSSKAQTKNLTSPRTSSRLRMHAPPQKSTDTCGSSLNSGNGSSSQNSLSAICHLPNHLLGRQTDSSPRTQPPARSCNDAALLPCLPSDLGLSRAHLCRVALVGI
eukprot:6212174-Pleurochrysis_carterae.AAC.2